MNLSDYLRDYLSDASAGHRSIRWLAVKAGISPSYLSAIIRGKFKGRGYIELREALENPEFVDLMIRAWNEKIEHRDFDLVGYLDRMLKVPQDQKAAILKLLPPAA